MAGTEQWTVRCPVRTRLSGVPVNRKLMLCVQRLEMGLGHINTTPTGHFMVWEPKQHIKAYSRHIQALPTTSIHWYISYTRIGYSIHIKSSQVPRKRDQARKSYSRVFSDSALRESLRESVCYLLWSFECGVLTHIHCKASKSPLYLWLALRRLWSFIDKEEGTLVGLGDRWREGKGWKRLVLSGLLNGD
jgi:hypothetical protein